MIAMAAGPEKISRSTSANKIARPVDILNVPPHFTQEISAWGISAHSGLHLSLQLQEGHLNFIRAKGGWVLSCRLLSGSITTYVFDNGPIETYPFIFRKHY